MRGIVSRMRQFAVVSDETQMPVEFFPDRDAAEAFVAEVAEDEPETAATLDIEPVEFETSPN